METKLSPWGPAWFLPQIIDPSGLCSNSYMGTGNVCSGLRRVGSYS